MATGDAGNNAAKVRRQLQAIQYPYDATTAAQMLYKGSPASHLQELLRVLHYTLLDYSRFVAEQVQAADLDLYGRTDAKFVDGVFRFSREHLGYFPSLTSTQFLSPTQFRERKLIIIADLLGLVAKRHAEAQRAQRIKQTVWVPSHQKPAGRTPARQVQSPVEMTDHRKSTVPAWQSVNLGQTKPSRVVRHTPPAPTYRVTPLLATSPPDPPVESSIFDWDTPIEGASYKQVDTTVLKALPPPTPHWVESHFPETQPCDEDDIADDVYPRQLHVQPSTDPVRPPRPAPDVHDALAVLQATLCSKLDDILSLVSDKFAKLEDRLTVLEAKVEPRGSPNQEEQTPVKEPNALRTTSAVGAVYRWPPEPSAFRKV
ncbi:hypothetical protein ACHHYP_05730 [Achlya hypogyna]|uniref:Centrosomal protein of 44 kDa n=1 Tax=Achlya hypogyna TaxID=1202772 RepID=A0A1V9YX22_ACHHY|nr:hypothetical protein ACHHYP_05730 [Achlya hypogyna]